VPRPAPVAPPPRLGALELGILVGLLVGEGSFGGDGRQPQVTLRMHVDHEALFHWLVDRVPGGRLYGPYHHGGRHYYQWMVRGAYLREHLVPLLDPVLVPELDARVASRWQAMKARYGLGRPGP
jgi:hypothetical protein